MPSRGATAAVQQLARLNEVIPDDASSTFYRGPARRAWQAEALEAWTAAGRRGVVEAVTGTGKTTVGVLAIAEALRERRRAVVLVPGLDLLEQWVRVLRTQLRDVEIGRLGGGERGSLATHRVVVATVQSAANGLSPRAGALLVADEVHRYGTQTYAEALLPSYEWRLGLTATYERTDRGISRHLEPYFGAVVAGCDYRRGLDDGVLAPFRVGFVGVDLSARERSTYEQLQETAASTRMTLLRDHRCPARPFGEYLKAVQRLAGGGSHDEGARVARRYLAAFNERRALVAECAGKGVAVAALVDVLRTAGRGLVFAETVAGADGVARALKRDGVQAEAYTSELDQRSRRRLMRAFAEGRVRVLSAPRVLDEGIDVPEADTAVIVGASASRRQMVQRMGRVIRPKADGRAATFFVVYARGTHEDPARGAHEAFVDEMVSVARTIELFPASAGAADYFSWFLDGRPEDWRPPVVEVADQDVDGDEFEEPVVPEAAGHCLACRRGVRSVEDLNYYGVCVRCTLQPAYEDDCERCGHPRFDGWWEMEGFDLGGVCHGYQEDTLDRYRRY